jgi:hypothetical protein
MKYDLVLYGENEFFPKLNKKTYQILLADTNDKLDYIIDFFKKFIKIKSNKYIGIDFEFNKISKGDREVALCQINLEDDTDIANIFVFNPNEFSKTQNDTFIELLTNNEIGKTIKILHGAESLDIPYLFSQVLKTEKNINNFLYNFFDTKYLCEYYHIDKNITGKCSIYNLLEEHKIITNKKVKELESIEDKTGPIYLIEINIHKLDFNLFKYSLYDVIYLPELIKVFLNKSEMYTHIIPEIGRYVFRYKRLTEFKFNKLKEEINRLNVHFFTINKKPYFMNDFYDYVINTFLNESFEKILQITYYKEFMIYSLKYLVYSKLLGYNVVYEAKNKKYAKKLEFFFNSLTPLFNQWDKEIIRQYEF